MTRSFEFNSMNNIKNIGDFSIPNLKQTSPMVEIFSAITQGRDTNGFDGKNVDKVYARLKELGEQANNGSHYAKAEINTIVRYVIEPKLNELIQLAGFMGSYKNIGYEEQPMMKTYKHESIRSNFQASQADAVFGTTVWDEYPINTQTITSGFAVNYREIASGNLDRVSEGMKQVEIDMMNKSVYYIILKLYNAIKEAKGVKYFAENSGINKTALDDILKKVRHFGKPSIMGDFSVVSQLNDFAGFKADPSDAKNTFLSEAVMNEIRQTGLLSTYKGSPIVELANSYNLNSLNDAGDNFKTYLPEGLLFIVPQGNVSPLQIFKRGGITTMTGNDVVTGTELTRFDMELGVGVARGREYEIALLSDTNYELPEVK